MAAGTPDREAVVTLIGADHLVDGGESLAPAEEARVAYQFAGGTAIVFLVPEVKESVSDAAPGHEEGMEHERMVGNIARTIRKTTRAIKIIACLSLPAPEIHEEVHEAAYDTEDAGDQGDAHQDSQDIGNEFRQGIRRDLAGAGDIEKLSDYRSHAKPPFSSFTHAATTTDRNRRSSRPSVTV